ncbi:MAG TPA: ROK family transcriptional regulator [Gryllotalpicola sp.]
MVVRGGTNLPAVGGYNQAVILDAIRRTPDGVSRVELAARTGLSAQTVTNVSRRLLGAGVIREAGTVSAGIGKPRTMLQLSPRGRFAVGVHLDPSLVSIVLLDLAGDVLDHRVLDVDPASTARQTLDGIARETRSVIGAEGGLRERMLGVGIAAPGPLIEESGTILNPPLLPAWDRIAVRELLSDLLGLPVLLEKDVTAAAVAEQWTAEANRENFVFVYYGTGVGFGLVLQNEVIRAASGNAGDIGGLGVGFRAPGGRLRAFGAAVSPTRIVPDALSDGVLQPAAAERAGGFHLLDEFTELCRAADGGEARAAGVVDRVIADLADTLVPVANLLDVDRFVFGGPFWPPLAARALAGIPPAFAASPHLVGAHPVVFEESAVGPDVAAIGAACLVLDHAFSPRPARLLIAHAS